MMMMMMMIVFLESVEYFCNYPVYCLLILKPSLRFINYHFTSITLYSFSSTGDIMSGHLYYQLKTFNHQVTSDFFTFEVTDGQPGAVFSGDFHIQWTWVMMAATE